MFTLPVSFGITLKISGIKTEKTQDFCIQMKNDKIIKWVNPEEMEDEYIKEKLTVLAFDLISGPEADLKHV